MTTKAQGAAFHCSPTARGKALWQERNVRMKRFKHFLIILMVVGLAAAAFTGCTKFASLGSLKEAISHMTSATSSLAGSLTSSVQQTLSSATSAAREAVSQAKQQAASVQTAQKSTVKGTTAKTASQNNTPHTSASQDKGSQPVAPVVPVESTAPTPSALQASSSGATRASFAASSYFGGTAMQGVKVYEYGKSLLSGPEQSLYSAMVSHIINADKSFTVSLSTQVSDAQIGNIFNYIWYDHSEIFYLNGFGYSMSGSSKGPYTYTFTMNYAYSSSDIKSMYAQMASAEAQVYGKAMASLQAGQTSDYYVEKAMHDALIEHCGYDVSAIKDPGSTSADSFTAYGAFVKGVAVCDGYARAMKMLLSSANIPSLYVTGIGITPSSSGGHAWNMVYVPGTDGTYRWYYLDSTWDDSLIENSNGTFTSAGISYEYFNFVSEPADPRTHQVVTDHQLGSFYVFDPSVSGKNDSQNYQTMPKAGSTGVFYDNTGS